MRGMAWWSLLRSNAWKTRVAVEKSLVAAGKEEVTVLVANISHEARENPAGMKLETCEEVEHQVEQQEGEEAVTDEPLPDHLQDMAQRSVANLTKVQAERMCCLLAQ